MVFSLRRYNGHNNAEIVDKVTMIKSGVMRPNEPKKYPQICFSQIAGSAGTTGFVPPLATAFLRTSLPCDPIFCC
jgi:hypothetical protein